MFQLESLEDRIFIPTPVYSGMASPLEVPHSPMIMLATTGIALICLCISPRFLSSVVRQYTMVGVFGVFFGFCLLVGFFTCFSDRLYFVKEKALLWEKNSWRIMSEMAGADS